MKTQIPNYLDLKQDLMRKTIIRNAIVLLLAVSALQGKAQQTISMCTGSNAIISALNSLNLSNPSYSMNPGGITSTNATFTVSPIANTTYSLYVTGTNSNSAVVTTSSTVLVLLNGVSYSLTSPNSNTLGCASKSVGVVNITNAQTIPVAGGPVSYTLLSPGSSSTLPSGNLSSVSSYTVNTAGVYTVVVKDNTSLCATHTTITVTQNTVAPNISVSVPQQILDCNVSSTQLQGNSNSTNVSYVWSFPTVPGSQSGNALTVNTNSLAPSTTLIANYSLTVTDNNNTCTSTTVVPMYQNNFQPNAVIVNPLPPIGVCTHSVVLTNQSSTGIPSNSGFSTNLPVIGLLWEGPSPQPSVAFASTYTAQTSGIYTMTARDNNNGCIKTTTTQVILAPLAAFGHTITGGQASFNDTSTDTDSNTTYYWDFGDGHSSTLQNPSHTYTNGGSHFVKLKITKPSGLSGIFCSDSVIQSVNVSGVACLANSNFSMIPTSTPNLWDIVPVYPWNVVAARWSWGDMSPPTDSLYTVHNYAVSGMYNICLTVTVSCGDTSTSCTTHSVSNTLYDGHVGVVAPKTITRITEIQAKAQTSWSIIPNPNSGTFKLNFASIKSEPIHVVISDLTGRFVHDQLIAYDSDMVVETGEIVPGMYLVTLQTGNTKTTKRMIVSH